jgi:hypothetical protein
MPVFKKGNKAAAGHRPPALRPDFLTQTLISQLNEVDKDTKSEVKHKLVAKLIELALGGDVVAIREVFDRVQGKPAQAMSIDGTVNHEHEFAGAREQLSHILSERAERLRAREENLKLVGPPSGGVDPRLDGSRKT